MRSDLTVTAVVYGIGKDPVPISINPKDIRSILGSDSGKNTIFNLSIPGVEESPVMLRDWQNHPLKANLLHVDFQRIDLSKRLVVKVRVHTTGEPKGVKEQGGVYEQVRREVEIECLPDEIPSEFTVDVTEFRIGSALRVGDLPLSGSMKLLQTADLLISHLIAPARVEEVAPVEAAVVAAVAEPEVVKKGKKEEEGKEPEKKKDAEKKK
jgi:large subunit ribosomal protein L25